MPCPPSLQAACAAAAPRPLPPPGPHLAPLRMPSLFDSVEGGGLQPAIELRHVQGHNHETDVLRALAARDLAPSLESGLSRACMPLAPLSPAAPSCLPARTSPRASYVLLSSTRQQASAFNQPLSLDTSSVTDMTKMLEVRSARTLTPSIQTAPPCEPLAPPPPHVLPPPGPHLAPHRMPSFRLGSKHRRSTSR